MGIVRVPKYGLHAPTGQAYVRIRRRMIYLGKHGTPASREAYGRAIAEMAASPSTATITSATMDDLTVVELCAGYLRFAKDYYTKNGRPSDWLCHIRLMVGKLSDLYGRTLATEFGPLKFKAIRQTLIDAGHSRPYINKLMAIVPRVFKWAAAEELVPAAVYHALRTVDGLKKGRTKAREPKPVMPVEESLVEATLPHLPKIVADMVRFERLTGCRPSEVCQLRPGDIDRTRPVWAYRPGSHKTEHHDRERVIFIGPKAQEVILPYLLRDTVAYCFSPAESVRGMRDARRTARKTPLHYGNRPGTNRKARPQRTPKLQYTKDSYARAIRRGVTKANKAILEEAKKAGVVNPALLPYWAPNRLRHAAGTTVRRQFGLEAAQVILGHAKADVTQVYAERDQALAAEVMGKIG
ncbi:MAG: tyrosine-type recombinase/integrase [Thermoguttaceae bacterium]